MRENSVSDLSGEDQSAQKRAYLLAKTLEVLKQMIRTLLVSSFLVLVVGCSDSGYSDYVEKLVSPMQWIRSADPEKDANEALKNNDFRYLAITSYSLTFPGLPDNKTPNANKEDGYRIIGYCELMEGEEHIELCVLAGQYAKKYNKTLSSLVVNQKTSNKSLKERTR
ncbi:hypothetical protein [Candidatus Reidiella endopervernicosa]|uniref:Uncharacterized protein n=1 Tax=Candidatus Reidiella endopervernicosa TaxID=2738883 RepID=A0A6N0HWD0_9GAMM|nr:hypothetical protein [Candidatus Reidiella endopervernicosa]QKQ26680.1 hypothetical protein HUE57_10610 [Candidatus Reidiella endopervernicosa]